MKKFNTSDLFTGYIKQLLHDFNLPKYKVYTRAHKDYFEKHPTESPEILGTEKYINGDTSLNIRYFPYIKDGEIQEYINGKWTNIRENKPGYDKTYTYNKKILNCTKNLKINSNVYDSYTHEYLGDYLRFHRDFLDLNLMPLYNCFSNRACDKLKLNWTIGDVENNGAKITFDTSDSNFKIYMIPVKLFQKYTIAIDSAYPIEMCCGIYGDYQDKRPKFVNIPKYTYKRVATSLFSQPFLYDLLAYTDDNETNTLLERFLDNEKIELAQNECDLKLFIKIPVQNDSSIVILEGDYRNWNDNLYADKPYIQINVDAYYTSVPTTTAQNDIGKVYLVNQNDGTDVRLYKVIAATQPNETADKNHLVQTYVGELFGLDPEDEFMSSRFNFVYDDSISTKKTLVEAFDDYKNLTTTEFTKPFIAYFNNKYNNDSIGKGPSLLLITKGLVKRNNKTTVNLDTHLQSIANNHNFVLATPLQLLHLNTKEQHPFADRLIEYLVGNAITNSENEIYDNVRRAQKALKSNVQDTYYSINIPGVWSNSMRILFYEYMTTNKQTNKFNINHDILGYVDKDVEKYYQATFDDYKTNRKIKISLSNLELEEDDK